MKNLPVFVHREDILVKFMNFHQRTLEQQKMVQDFGAIGCDDAYKLDLS